MVKIDYTSALLGNHLPHLFTLLKGDLDGLFYICVGPKLIAIIDKMKDGWQQIGGDEVPAEFVAHMGKVIEDKLNLPVN
jgi:hypothetical protein